jgi:hypothetical protein
VAVLGTSTPGNAQALKETEFAAGAFGVQLQYLDILGPKDIDPAFRAASKGRADAVLVLAGPTLLFARCHIRGQDSQRREARRLASRAAEKVRAGDKFEGGQADRPDDSTQRAGAGGQSDPVIAEK